jgi:hypothetical protein
LPLFHGGGSDATLLLQDDAKTSTWLFSGILATLSLPLYFLVFYEQKKSKRILYIILLIICAISDGKKGGLLEFFVNIVLVAGVSVNLRKSVTSKHVTLFVIVLASTFIFAAYQYAQTLNRAFTISDIGSSFSIILNLTNLSFSAYLEQMHVAGGLNLIHIYHEQLGEHNIFNYFFNSYIKLLGFDGGIKKGIGPFLNYWIYDSDRANGINPTFFYELIFVTGKKYYGIISIFIIPSIFYLIIRYYKKISSIRHMSIYKMAIYLFLIKFLISFLIDTLNAIRSLPFLFLLVTVYYISKIKLSTSA